MLSSIIIMLQLYVYNYTSIGIICNSYIQFSAVPYTVHGAKYRIIYNIYSYWYKPVFEYFE